MKTWVRRSLNAGALTAGALMAAGTAAHAADPTLVSSDNLGILNGTQALLPIQAPIDICGNAVAVAGVADAVCHGGAAAGLSPEWGFAHYSATTGPNIGIGNGTQILAPIQAPIDVCGNAVGVLGQALAGCAGGSTATNGGSGHGSHTGHGGQGGGSGHTPGCGCPGTESTESTEAGLLGGGGLIDGLPAVGGLLGGLTGSLGGGGDLLGGLMSGAGSTGALSGVLPTSSLLPLGTESVTEGGYVGGQGGGYGHPTPKPKPKPCGCQDGHGGHDHGAKLISTGNVGVLNGTQVYAPVQIPINISGNAIGVLGSASAWSVGGASAHQ
ncbi:chaplin family protein [Hamadaea tsunoensis]|uniref:chaplin family protein n=1 Tax=Hamadaea tsunoensis TaxID=53368 RepID=UPI000418A460|nr:chaplin family protein [Hamadaea tsunoensis]